MSRFAATLLSALALAALASPARAAEAQFGLQGTLSLPLADLKPLVDSGKGFGLGLFADCPLSAGHVLRPRLDYLQYQTATFGAGPSREERSWTTTSLGVDYLYYPAGKAEGFYAAAGLAANLFHQELKIPGQSLTSQTTRLGASLGAGYVFSEHWEVNVRYSHTSTDSVTMAALNAGVAYRF